MGRQTLKKRTVSTKFLRFSLIFFSMLLTVGMIYFFTVSRKSLTQESKLNTIDSVQRIVQEKNYLLTLFLEDGFRYSESIATFVMQDDIFDLSEGIALANATNKDSHQSINFFDTEGNLAIANESMQSSISDSSYFQTVMDGERTITNILFYSEEDMHPPMISLLVPIKASDGSVHGGVIYSYTIPEMEQKLTSESLLSLGNLILIDREKKILFGIDFFQTSDNFFDSSKEYFNNFNETLQSDMINNIDQMMGGYVEFESNSQNLVMIYESNELSGWTLVNLLYEDDLNDYTNAILKNYLRIFATGITLVILLYSFILLLSFKLLSTIDHRRRTLEHEKEELSDKTMKDSMTKLLNKSSGMEIINSIIEGSTPDHKHALFFIDIDNFKKINDTYGHDLGDEAIMNLSDYLRRNFRSHDVITRFGGDEFVVFVQNFPDAKVIPILADRLCMLIEESNRGSKIKFTISIGISMYPTHATNYDGMVACADKALYVSKNSGKNKYTIYNPLMDSEE